MTSASMRAPALLHELALAWSERTPTAVALRHQGQSLGYGALGDSARALAGGLIELGLARGARVAVFLEQRFETAIASLGISLAGGVAVPVNPVLKAPQVAHVMRDCSVEFLVTSEQRLAQLGAQAAQLPALRHVLLVDEVPVDGVPAAFVQHRWADVLAHGERPGRRVIDADLAMIFYTSGSTGKPKGVMVSHRNLVAGAQSVAGYLENHAGDVLLAALPLSFDAGFSQLTTAWCAGARVVLLNYLLPRDLLRTMQEEGVTGITAVPPLYAQIARLKWPQAIRGTLRYFASTGGRMPRPTLDALRAQVPDALPYLMYGLTEAFRSTYLPPQEVDRRPDSIGRAIPGAEVLVLRPDGIPCAPGEPGELVHRGALVGLGYWNDPVRTAERYKPLPAAALGDTGRGGRTLEEIAVFSGDTARTDSEGFLYFVGREDEMIKTSGYRVSPTEVEELMLATGLVGECAAFGVADPVLGQTITAFASPSNQENAQAALVPACRTLMPRYMVPNEIIWIDGNLPRTHNGKIDRVALRSRLEAEAPAASPAVESPDRPIG